MWPFRKSQPPEDLVQRLISKTLQLEHSVTTMAHQIKLEFEGIAAARAVERRVGTTEMAIKSLAAQRDEDVSRHQAALEILRGQITGPRGGRPRNADREAERQATELGERVIAAMSNPHELAKLVAELSARMAPQSPI